MSNLLKRAFQEPGKTKTFFVNTSHQIHLPLNKFLEPVLQSWSSLIAAVSHLQITSGNASSLVGKDLSTHSCVERSHE